MLSRIINVIKSSEANIDGDSLICSNYTVEDVECLQYLEENNVYEQPILDIRLGTTINLELSLTRLNSIGFYENIKSLVIKHRYVEASHPYYIWDIQCYNHEENSLIDKYRAVLSLGVTLENLSRHSYDDLNVKTVILFRENTSLFLPLIYTYEIFSLIDLPSLNAIKGAVSVLNGDPNEKKILFLNELIDFLQAKEEIERFSHLIKSFKDYSLKANNSYQFYLSNFSYNKLKFELDSKAIEFTQKIQAVINDSQGKLIAIPTAFVLAFSAFDFDDLVTIKNTACVLSLLVFSVIIQIFIQNQKSALKFIDAKMSNYKADIKISLAENISSSFRIVDVELKKQQRRILLVEVILWAVPFCWIILWCYLSWINSFFS